MKPKLDQSPWVYKGFNVYPAELNSSGIRWYAFSGLGAVLKADTKQGMRRLITEIKGKSK